MRVFAMRNEVSQRVIQAGLECRNHRVVKSEAVRHQVDCVIRLRQYNNAHTELVAVLSDFKLIKKSSTG